MLSREKKAIGGKLASKLIKVLKPAQKKKLLDVAEELEFVDSPEGRTAAQFKQDFKDFAEEKTPLMKQLSKDYDPETEMLDMVDDYFMGLKQSNNGEVIKSFKPLERLEQKSKSTTAPVKKRSPVNAAQNLESFDSVDDIENYMDSLSTKDLEKFKNSLSEDDFAALESFLPRSTLNRREQKSLGGKLAKPLLKRVAKFFPDAEEKEIKTTLKKINTELEAASQTMKKEDAIIKVAEDNGVTPGAVRDMAKVEARKRGGGKSDNTLERIVQIGRAAFTKPTAGQSLLEGVGDQTRAANVLAGKTALVGTGVGSLLGAGAMKAWDSQNDSAPTKKESTAFEKAFSKAHNAGKKTFKFEGKEYTTDVRKGKAEGGEISDEDSFRMMYNSYKQEMEAAESPEEQKRIQQNFQKQTQNVDQEVKMNVFKEKERSTKAKGGASRGVDSEWPKEGRDYHTINDQWYWEGEKIPMSQIRAQARRNMPKPPTGKRPKEEEEKEKERSTKAEGGSLLVPPEMGMEEEMPVDTFTPEEQAMAEESQVPDDQMEDDYMSFVLDESLDETEQQYLMGALESDSRLSEIFDKVIMTASEFSGAGEVEGPGTGVSDSIPARLSDGEFVITEEATSEIGADNLQTMMDDAERKASGGKVGYAEGGLLSNPYGMPNQQMEEEENRIEQSMLGANQMPSLMGGRR